MKYKIFILLLIIINCIVFFSSKKTIPDVEFPFKNIKDENNKNLNIMAITAPFRSDKDKDLFNEYTSKYNIPMIGIASYLNFPGEITHPYDDPYYKKHFNSHNYIDSCLGWCHCFRDPTSRGLGLDKKPLLSLSESDLVSQGHKTNTNKIYDFIYVCLQDNKKCEAGWQSENRNWELAKKCFPIMCKEFNLKGLLVGRTNCDVDIQCNNLISIVGDENNEGKIDYFDFQKKLAQSRFLFVPNIRDASPRVLTEALAVDVPVLVNKNIYGGWKYINEETGEFFNNEQDFPIILRKLLTKIKQKKYNPRKWFTTNYGPKKTGKVLRDFLKKIYPELWDCEYCSFTK